MIRQSTRPFVALLLFGLLAACGADENHEQETQEQDAQPATLLSTDEFQATTGEFGPRDEMPGAQLYAQHCAHCHTGQVPKAPHLIWLELMSPDAILRTMNGGIMAAQSAALAEEERVHVAEYITRSRAREPGSQPALPMCADASAGFVRNVPPKPVGWGHDTARFVSNANGGIDAQGARRLALKWAFAFPDALRARSQPSIGYGAVFVGSHDGTVYAFDLETGCVRWTFQASAEVRTGVVLTLPDVARPLALFGDILARVYALDAFTGELVWSRKADDHPSATLTGTPALHGDRLFVPVSSLEVVAAADPAYECCTFRGKVLAVDATTGETLWEHFSIPEEPAPVGVTSAGTRILSPSGAPIWSSPAIDVARNRLYVGTGENYSTPADGNSDAVIAIDMTSGRAGLAAPEHRRRRLERGLHDGGQSELPTRRRTGL